MSLTVSFAGRAEIVCVFESSSRAVSADNLFNYDFYFFYYLIFLGFHKHFM